MKLDPGKIARKLFDSANHVNGTSVNYPIIGHRYREDQAWCIRSIFSVTSVANASPAPQGGVSEPERSKECVQFGTQLTSDRQDDFAELRAGFEIGMGLGASGQGEDAVDNGLEASGGHQAHDPVEL